MNAIILALLAAILPTAVAITLAMSRPVSGARDKSAPLPRRSRSAEKALRAEGNR